MMTTLTALRDRLGTELDVYAFAIDLHARGYRDLGYAAQRVNGWVDHGVPAATARSMFINFTDADLLKPAPPCLECRPDLAAGWEPDVPGSLAAQARELHVAVHDLTRSSWVSAAATLRRLAKRITP